MIRSVTNDITVVDGAEELEDIVTAQPERNIEILSVTAEVNDDVNIRGYVNTDRIVDVGLGCDALSSVLIPVEFALSQGQTFRVGFLNNSGSSVTLQATVFYRES